MDALSWMRWWFVFQGLYWVGGIALSLFFTQGGAELQAQYRAHPGELVAAIVGLGVFGVLPAYLTSLAVLPRSRPDFLYLRNFRSDASSLDLKYLLEIAVGLDHRLAGIRSPRRRTPLWMRPVLAPILQFQYSSPRHMGLEAGRDWPARLWRSLADCHGVFLDVREATRAVEFEGRLCAASIRPSRMAVIIDDTKPASSWREWCASAFGLSPSDSERLTLLPCLPGSVEPDGPLVRRVRRFVATVVASRRLLPQAGFALVAPHMANPADRVRERLGVVSVIAGLGLVLGRGWLASGDYRQWGILAIMNGGLGAALLVIPWASALRLRVRLARLEPVAAGVDPLFADSIRRRRRFVAWATRLAAVPIAAMLGLALGLLLRARLL